VPSHRGRARGQIQTEVTTSLPAGVASATPAATTTAATATAPALAAITAATAAATTTAAAAAVATTTAAPKSAAAAAAAAASLTLHSLVDPDFATRELLAIKLFDRTLTRFSRVHRHKGKSPWSTALAIQRKVKISHRTIGLKQRANLILRGGEWKVSHKQFHRFLSSRQTPKNKPALRNLTINVACCDTSTHRTKLAVGKGDS
jgi:hypothetical protein